MNATPFDCHACGRRIGRDRRHIVIRNKYVLCVNCIEKRANHPVYYPDCPWPWHDMFDHGFLFATRGGAHRLLAETEEQ